MNDEFKAKRALMHQIVEIWRQMYGEWWVVVVGRDEFYFPVRCETELAIRENLMSRTYNELDAIAMSVMLNMETR